MATYRLATTTMGMVPDLGDQPNDLSCLLFEFIMNTVFTGLMCLFGFAGNTLSFIALWNERSHSAVTFLLQALAIADVALIWMVFIADVIPGLAYLIPILRNCDVVCYYIGKVTRPVLYMAQFCVVWLTLCAATNRFMVMCKPKHASLASTIEFARKQVIAVLICAVVFCLPLTFDRSVQTFLLRDDGTVLLETLQDNKWYHAIYLNAFIFVLFHLVPLVVIFYLTIRLVQVMQSIKRLRRALATEFKSQHMDMSQVALALGLTVIICYLPLTVLRAVQWSQEEATHLCGHLQYYLDSFCNLFLVLNSCIKLLIYCLFARNFWNSLCSTFCWRSTKRSDGNPFGPGMYKCQDMSEMTLISHVEGRS